MNEQAVISLIREEKERAGGVRALARKWGISPCHISDLLNGRRGPGPSVLKPLGLTKVETVEYQTSR